MIITNLRDRNDLLDQMAEILEDGFYLKFSKILGTRDQFRESIKVIINRELCYGYLESNNLKGVAVLKDKTTHPVLYPFNKLRKVLGFFSALKAKIMLYLIFGLDKVDSDTLKLEIISVSKDSRGEGIGHKLLEHVEKYAKDKGFKTLTLDVIDTNPRAKKLYEETGYIEIKYTDTSKMTKNVGFNGIYTMDKKL